MYMPDRKWTTNFGLFYFKRSSTRTFQHAVNANELCTYAFPGSCRCIACYESAWSWDIKMNNNIGSFHGDRLQPTNPVQRRQVAPALVISSRRWAFTSPIHWTGWLTARLGRPRQVTGCVITERFARSRTVISGHRMYTRGRNDLPAVSWSQQHFLNVIERSRWKRGTGTWTTWKIRDHFEEQSSQQAAWRAIAQARTSCAELRRDTVWFWTAMSVRVWFVSQ